MPYHTWLENVTMVAEWRMIKTGETQSLPVFFLTWLGYVLLQCGWFNLLLLLLDAFFSACCLSSIVLVLYVVTTTICLLVGYTTHQLTYVLRSCFESSLTDMMASTWYCIGRVWDLRWIRPLSAAYSTTRGTLLHCSSNVCIVWGLHDMLGVFRCLVFTIMQTSQRTKRRHSNCLMVSCSRSQNRFRIFFIFLITQIVCRHGTVCRRLVVVNHHRRSFMTWPLTCWQNCLPISTWRQCSLSILFAMRSLWTLC